MSTGNPSESEAQGVWWGIWWSQRILTEFSKLNCKREGLDTLLKKICETGSTNQRHESRRPKHMHTKGNINTVDELVGLLSQEDQTQTHCSTRQISDIQRDGSNTV